jgi:hypothetical protein
MTTNNIIPATPSNRKQWRANQCVTIGCGKRSQLLVTSRQTRSTPGIYTEVYLKQNTLYCASVSGQALGNARAFVFVYNPQTKERLIPNYTFLPSNCFGCVDVDFRTPACANEYQCIWLGVLFTQPCNGHQYCLQEIRIGNANQPAPVQAPPLPGYALSSPQQCTSVKPVYKKCNEPCEDSIYSDDDSCDNVEMHHHHHYVGSHSTDPYYTYNTNSQPCPPEHVAPAVSSPVYCETDTYTKPVGTEIQSPVTIADLQSSLSTMISQLK